MARHKSFAEQLAAFKISATTPDHVPEPIETNWSTVPANDNNQEDIADMHVERLMEISPSVTEIMRQAKNEPETNADGQVVAIGRLRFSDGTQTEKAYRRTIDGGIQQYDARMPTGSMLGTKDEARNERGGDDNPEELTASNRYFGDMFGVKLRAAKKATKRPAVRLSFTHQERVDMLERAKANTDMRHVTVTHCPDGLPSASDKMADNFVGMKKSGCSGGGSMAWEDISSQRESRNDWFRAVELAGDETVDFLSKATKARSLRQIGEARGYVGQYAVEAGKRLLIAANDNMQEAINLANYARST